MNKEFIINIYKMLQLVQMKMKVLLTIIILMAQVNAKYLPINKIVNKPSPINEVKVGLSNNNTTLSFGNYGDVIYYIDLQVGTPPQTLGVQFDTGSNILWLPTQKSGAPIYFNTSKSSTFTNTSNQYSITYADNSYVAGTFGTDILAIAATPISITAQFLWVTQQISMNFPNQIQGLVGMGYTTIPNFLDVAYSNNQISSPVFALEIQSQPAQSYVYFNGIPQSIMNSTQYVGVVGNEYWQVSVLGVMVGGIDMTSLSANIAIIDSGTSYFYLNQDLFYNIVNVFFHNCNNNFQTPQCYCSDVDNWPTFSFLFEGIQVYIQPSQYVGQLTTTICTYNFGTLSTVSEILLGDIFFQGYIITFDKPNSQIGFKGNLGNVQNVIPNGGQLFGYISMGIIGFAILMGFIAACCMSGDGSKYSGGMEITKNNTIQISKGSYQGKLYNPNNYIRQAML